MSAQENVIADAGLVLAPPAETGARSRLRLPGLGALRLALIVPVAFWLFLLGLGAMKSGAQALAPTLEGSIFTDSLPSALGLG